MTDQSVPTPELVPSATNALVSYPRTEKPIHRVPDSIKRLEERLSRKENILHILLLERDQLSTAIRISPDYITLSLAQRQAIKTLTDERSRCHESIFQLQDDLVSAREELSVDESCEACDRRVQEAAGEAERQLMPSRLLVKELANKITEMKQRVVEVETTFASAFSDRWTESFSMKNIDLLITTITSARSGEEEQNILEDERAQTEQYMIEVASEYADFIAEATQLKVDIEAAESENIGLEEKVREAKVRVVNVEEIAMAKDEECESKKKRLAVVQALLTEIGQQSRARNEELAHLRITNSQQSDASKKLLARVNELETDIQHAKEETAANESKAEVLCKSHEILEADLRSIQSSREHFESLSKGVRKEEECIEEKLAELRDACSRAEGVVRSLENDASDLQECLNKVKEIQNNYQLRNDEEHRGVIDLEKQIETLTKHKADLGLSIQRSRGEQQRLEPNITQKEKILGEKKNELKANQAALLRVQTDAQTQKESLNKSLEITQAALEKARTETKELETRLHSASDTPNSERLESLSHENRRLRDHATQAKSDAEVAKSLNSHLRERVKNLEESICSILSAAGAPEDSSPQGQQASSTTTSANMSSSNHEPEPHPLLSQPIPTSYDEWEAFKDAASRPLPPKVPDEDDAHEGDVEAEASRNESGRARVNDVLRGGRGRPRASTLGQAKGRGTMKRKGKGMSNVSSGKEHEPDSEVMDLSKKKSRTRSPRRNANLERGRVLVERFTRIETVSEAMYVDYVDPVDAALFAETRTGHTGVTLHPPTEIDLAGGAKSAWNNFIIEVLGARLRLASWKASPTGEDQGVEYNEDIIRGRVAHFCYKFREQSPQYSPFLGRDETQEEAWERVDTKANANRSKSKFNSRLVTKYRTRLDNTRVMMRMSAQSKSPHLPTWKTLNKMVRILNVEGMSDDEMGTSMQGVPVYKVGILEFRRHIRSELNAVDETRWRHPEMFSTRGAKPLARLQDEDPVVSNRMAFKGRPTSFYEHSWLAAQIPYVRKDLSINDVEPFEWPDKTALARAHEK